jgi:hypothetical protein
MVWHKSRDTNLCGASEYIFWWWASLIGLQAKEVKILKLLIS